MYNPEELTSGLLDVVGWRQNLNSAGSRLLGLTESKSGLYFNDIHPLLTHDNITSLSASETWTYPAFSASSAYAVGEVVDVSGTLHECIQATTAGTTTDQTDFWKETNAYTQFVKEKTEAGILAGIRAWYQMKVNDLTARNLVEREQLFTQAGDLTDVEPVASGKMAGLEIALRRFRGLRAEIQQIGIQFDTAGTYTFRLFKSDKVSPVGQPMVIEYTEAGSVQWESLVWASRWILQPEGTYFIAWERGEVPGEPINGTRDYAIGKGGLIEFCGDSFIKSKFFEVRGFSVDGSSSSLWDIKKTSRTLSTNYGINVRMSVTCDYTDLILEQKLIFQDVIALHVAKMFLRQLALNPDAKTTRNERNIDTTAVLYEIDGDSQGRPGGLQLQAEKAVKALRFSTEGIDRVCLPCRRSGISFGSATR